MHIGTEEPLIGSRVRTNKTVKIAQDVLNKYARHAHSDVTGVTECTRIPDARSSGMQCIA